MNFRPAFIVLEGGEGSGKSTQVARVAAQLRALGADVVETFEPGGTALGARLRELLLHNDDAVDPRAELLLLASDRAQHVEEVIAPALEAGAVVVCDRYSPSTLAYQGVARGLGVDIVEDVCRFAEGDIEPDVVVVLDVSDEVALERASADPDRLERAGAEFHATVRQAYRDLAARKGWTVIDGSGPVDVVFANVWAAVAPFVEPPSP
ncbi:MAG: dTMP kinase [Actinomycetia bacterium]|nr:dTMP kinase [Actinomycetes bacterium]